MAVFQRKCEQYWCDEVGDMMFIEEANLNIITTSITSHRDFVIRTMNVKKVCKELKNVPHLQKFVLH